MSLTEKQMEQWLQQNHIHAKTRLVVSSYTTHNGHRVGSYRWETEFFRNVSHRQNFSVAYFTDSSAMPSVGEVFAYAISLASSVEWISYQGWLEEHELESSYLTRSEYLEGERLNKAIPEAFPELAEAVTNGLVALLGVNA